MNRHTQSVPVFRFSRSMITFLESRIPGLNERPICRRSVEVGNRNRNLSFSGQASSREGKENRT